MFHFILSLFKKIGLDKAILFTSASNILGIFGNVFTVILVISQLSKIEQGYYYTFGSLLSIQLFFELGFNGIITQYVAHESAHLEIKSNQYLTGNQFIVSRLASLFKLIVKWYLIVFFLLVFILTAVGFYFFKANSTNHISIEWQEPWMLLVIAASLNFLVSPLLAFLSGLGKIADIAKYQFYQNTIRILFIIFSLYFGLNLYSLGLGLIFSTFFIYFIIYQKYYSLFIFLWDQKLTFKISYKQEIFPYQWRIALSWISGYFIFQMFNPVLFSTEGPVVAGQMGMTLAVISGVSTLSISWMTTKVPFFSQLIAKKDFENMRYIFNKTFSQFLFVIFLLYLLVFLSIFLFGVFGIEFNGSKISDRFLNYDALFFMIGASITSNVVASWAILLRCFKKEPYLVNSITGAICVTISTIYLGGNFGVFGLTLGYFILSLLFLPWAYYVYKKQMKVIFK